MQGVLDLFSTCFNLGSESRICCKSTDQPYGNQPETLRCSARACGIGLWRRRLAIAITDTQRPDHINFHTDTDTGANSHAADLGTDRLSGCSSRRRSVAIHQQWRRHQFVSRVPGHAGAMELHDESGDSRE